MDYDIEENNVLSRSENLKAPSSNLISSNIVTSISHCATKDVRYLCIYNLQSKVKSNDEFEVGGTCGEHLEYWFSIKCSSTFGINLISIFVQATSLGQFSIGISKDNKLHQKQTTVMNQQTNVISLGDELTWYSFNNILKDKPHYIKTYSITDAAITELALSTLYIPILIKNEILATNNIVNSLKIKHNIGEHLYELNDKDFTLEDSLGSTIKIHKIVLAAHSPVFRTKLKETSYDREREELLNETEMKMFVEFLYKVNTDKLVDINYIILMKVACKYQIKSLMIFVEHVATKQLKVNNVIDIAILADEYKLPNLLENCCEFIANHKEVLKTDKWKTLNDVNLTKKLFEYLQNY